MLLHHFFLVGILPGVLLTQQDERASGTPPVTMREVAAKYEIEIISANPAFPEKTHWGLIDGRKAEIKDLDRYRGLFCEEFSLYPLTLVKKTRLKRIVLCQELTFQKQRRYAIPDFEHDTYYLEAGTPDRSF